MRAHLRTWLVGLLMALFPAVASAAVESAFTAATGPAAAAVAGCPNGTNWDAALGICR